MRLDPQPAAEEPHEVYGEDYYRNERFFEGAGETIYGCHPRAWAVLERMMRWSGLSRQQLRFDPRIKMVVHARRGGTS